MKLCPQCEFIYEDDQKFCDMDGENLVSDTRSGVFPPAMSTVPAVTAAVPAVTAAKPKKSPLKNIVMAVVAGFVLSALGLAYYASSPSLDSDSASRSRKLGAPEKSRQQQIAPPLDNSSSQPTTSPSQSPTNPKAAPDSGQASGEELTDKPASESARSHSVPKTTDRTLRASDNRLTIARHLPPLPRLTPLPRLPPPRRLPAANPEGKQPGVTARPHKQGNANQKLAMPNQKQSRVRSFLKKTGRILSKPFKL